MLTKSRITWLFFSFLFIQLKFEVLSFGDGTGYAGEDGTALPRKIPEQSSPGCCAEPGQLHMKPTAAELVSYRPVTHDGGTWPQSPTPAASPEERELENKIPEHVPIRIKIRKEKEQAFKDLTNEHWVRDFELEVKNTGTKPIYFLVLILDLPKVRVGNGNMVFALRYGRVALNGFEEKLELAKPEDVPIKPGDTYVFRLAQSLVEAWERFMLKEQRLQPKRILIKFQDLNFGDGTGFRNVEGIPIPKPSPIQGRSSTVAFLSSLPQLTSAPRVAVATDLIIT